MKQHIQSALRSTLVAAGCFAAVSAWAVTPGAASHPAVSPPAKPSASMSQGNEYGNASDKAAVQPSREAVQEQANQPSASVLDDNAQRQHDRDQGITQRPSGDTAGTTRDGQPTDNTSGSMGSSTSSDSSASGMSSGSDASMPATRDWNKIDTDGNHSISPQEMDSWLQQNRPHEGSAPQK